VLDPDLDPFSIVGRFLAKRLFERSREAIDPKRAFYEVQKVKVRLSVPSVYHELSSKRLLVLSFVDGVPIRETPDVPERYDAARQLIESYYRQVLVDGFFHADPHPGNVFLTDDGRIALLDLGMVGRLSPELQEQLTRLVVAVSEGRGAEVSQITIQMGEKRNGFDQAGFTERTSTVVTHFQEASAQNVEVGRILLEVFRSAAESGLRLPVEMAMLGRALLALDQVGANGEAQARARAELSEVIDG
jgi:predicted unusual protein kinase regulating ubiquinone biosynthesis (AarF/ABC1/UbiB family)